MKKPPDKDRSLKYYRGSKSPTLGIAAFFIMLVGGLVEGLSSLTIYVAGGSKKTTSDIENVPARKAQPRIGFAIFLIVLVFALMAAALFTKPDGSSSKSSLTTVSKCTLPITQSPKLQGLSLGMTVAQIRARYPSLAKELEQSRPSYGLVSNSFLGRKNSPHPSLFKRNYGNKEIKDLYVELLDGRTTYIKLIYPDAQWVDETGWSSSKPFALHISKLLNLPDAWEHDHFSSTLNCNGFSIEANVDEGSVTDTYPCIRIQDLNADNVVNSRQEKEKIKQLKEEENEARRGRETFKP